MRLFLVSLATLTVVMAAGAAPSRAQSPYDYPICAIYQDKSGAQACYYSTYEQCMATMSGIGGYCTSNPAYRGRAAATLPGDAGVLTATPHRKVRRHRS